MLLRSTALAAVLLAQTLSKGMTIVDVIRYGLSCS
jgi:hypothetical protein